MGDLLSRAVARAHLATLRAGARRFRHAASQPATAQRRIAERLLDANRDTAYAREHRIRDLASLRAAPIVDADAMRPWWRRIEAGEENVATREPVLMMEPSGGSTGDAKLVPYTRSLLAEFAAATGPWMRDLHEHHAIARGSAYWSISPAGAEGARTSGGIPVGFGDDTEYFGPVARWGLRRWLAVPPEVARIRDVPSWRAETARRLVEARDLTLLSVWSPTFLTLLMEEVERQTGESDGERIWPRLALISCWTDATSAGFLPALRRHFPTVPIQPKGLLATEGVVSFPLEGQPAPILAVNSHFLEFFDLTRPGTAPVLAHELAVGRRYSPVLTTGGGLWRYHLKDVVTCVGHHLHTPLVRYEGRLDHVSDLCGEKVSLGQAERALAAAFQKLETPPRFALLAPSLEGRAHYRLFVETDGPVDTLANVADHALHEAYPYRQCRALGQLGPLKGVRVRDGLAAYERVLVDHGQRAGAVKPSALDTRPRWDDAFEVVH